MNRGGKFFRPPAPNGEAPVFDSSSDDDSDDEGEMPPPRNVSSSNNISTTNGNRNNDKTNSSSNANLSSSDDDDDDDDDDEGEVEAAKAASAIAIAKNKRKNDDDTGAKNKKAKKTSTSAFFDEYAEASDDDLDEEPYGTHHDPHDRVKKHYSDSDIRRENMDQDALDIIERQNRRRQNERMLTFDSDAAEVAKQLEERHRMQSRRVDRNIIDDASVADGNPNLSAVTQQSLLPSVSDPSLWMFSCANGKEKELVIQIMNKCIAFARQGKPLGITSAIAAQSKGKVYIESFSEPSVKEAVQGIRGLMSYTMRMVPINDMTTVMTVVPKKKPVKKNEWVRMTRGPYKGDLALVRAVRGSGLKCVIQCVPRLDLTLSDLPPEEARIRRRTVRPPQKFFNAQEIAALGKQSLTRQRYPGLGDVVCDFFEGNYYDDGYLLKEVTVGTMVKPCTEDEPPTLDELQRFRNRNTNGKDKYDGEKEGENEGSKIAKSLLDELSELQGKTTLAKASNESGLIIGDTVETIEGDLIGLRGKLMSIDGSTVKVRPMDTSDLGDTLEVEFLISQVKKYVPVGAHVKVTSGRYANETGVIVAVEVLEGENDSTAVVLTDMTHKEISVRISQVQESAEVASGLDKLAGYELHDLVVLSGGGSTNEVGVITRVGREEFTVINNHGIVREVRPEELRGKRNAYSNRGVALDVQGNQIKVGDTVNVAEGPHKGKSATIKRLRGAQLFLYSQNRTEHAGIFVVRSRSCVLAGSRVQGRNANDGGANASFAQRAQSSQGPARGRKDDGLIGKTVRIQSGNWKGYIGTVADATPTHVQVELHSRLKKIMVTRERISVVGDKFGATEDPDRMNQNTNAPMTPFVGATPMHGGATPMHGSATPMHGAATPSHDSLGSGNDDVWRPGGVVDRPGDDDGSDWGSSATPTVSKQQDPFSTTSSTADTGGGWGLSNNDQSDGTWTPSTSEIQNEVSTTQSSSRNESVDISAMGAADGEEAPVWFMERVCVQLKGNDAKAVITETNNNVAVVELEDGSIVTIRASECTMVAPTEHDTVLVTGGAEVGVEGELICIDGSDAILKDSNSPDFKIVDLVHLAKIRADT